MHRLLLLLAALVSSAALASPLNEERVEHAGVHFRVVRVAPELVRVVWKDARGKPYRGFEQVRQMLADKGKSAGLMMNAGIFEPGGIPSGLHIEEGGTLRPVNPANGQGNFFLKPNGVIWIESVGAKREAFVGTVDAFQAREKIVAAMDSRLIKVGVQSGPLLLIAGQRHPAFREGSANNLVRNGVGVDDKGMVVFAITDRNQMVNLWDFAGLFLKLGCRDALFLDGDISQMAVNPTRSIESNQFGAMFVVER